MRKLTIGFVFAIFVSGLPVSGNASVDALKIYRKVYPDLKPDCQYCHVDKKPQKDDGKHELTPYGLKLKELMGEGKLTQEIIGSVGRHDEFKEEEELLEETAQEGEEPVQADPAKEQ